MCVQSPACFTGRKKSEMVFLDGLSARSVAGLQISSAPAICEGTQMKKPTGQVDARRGTALWGINRFRSDALVQLLNDLAGFQEAGIESQPCRQVSSTFAKITNLSSTSPGGSFWHKSIHVLMQEFQNHYIRWSSHQGPDAAEARRKTLQDLRKTRSRIANRVRENQFILQNELDLRLIQNMYEAMGELATSLPDRFKNLSRAVARFGKVELSSN